MTKLSLRAMADGERTELRNGEWEGDLPAGRRTVMKLSSDD